MRCTERGEDEDVSWVAEYATGAAGNPDGGDYDDDLGMDELDQDADELAAKPKKKKVYVDDVLGVGGEEQEEAAGRGQFVAISLDLTRTFRTFHCKKHLKWLRMTPWRMRSDSAFILEPTGWRWSYMVTAVRFLQGVWSPAVPIGHTSTNNKGALRRRVRFVYR